MMLPTGFMDRFLYRVHEVICQRLFVDSHTLVIMRSHQFSLFLVAPKLFNHSNLPDVLGGREKQMEFLGSIPHD